jgi:hypothetical protein
MTAEKILNAADSILQMHTVGEVHLNSCQIRLFVEFAYKYPNKYLVNTFAMSDWLLDEHEKTEPKYLFSFILLINLTILKITLRVSFGLFVQNNSVLH